MTKYTIAFDTICNGYQPVTNEDQQPVLYDSKEDAEQEIASDPEFYKDDCFVIEASEIGHKTIFYGEGEYND